MGMSESFFFSHVGKVSNILNDRVKPREIHLKIKNDNEISRNDTANTK